MIREWTRDMDAATRERILQETPRYSADSNLLCRIVAEAFMTKK